MLTTQQQAQAQSGINALHDFFKKTLYTYKDGEITVISENPNHNFLYDGAPTNTTTQTVTETGTITARIYYKDIPLEDMPSSENVVYPNGTIKVVTDISGSALLSTSDRVRFENELFKVESMASRHGLFAKQFYSYLLKPVL